MSAVPVVQWVTGAPLWPTAATDPARMQRPALLRYSSDAFMADLARDLETGPTAVTARVATPRSYRRRPVGTETDWDGSGGQLKLYQPAHGHFNLVAAALVCRVPGMPDRTLDMSDGETTGFVLRRRIPDGSGGLVEAAWTSGPGAQGWRAVDVAHRLVPGEEVLPLVGVKAEGDGRRLLVGLVPTSGGDAYRATGSLKVVVQDRDANGQPIDARAAEFETRVLGPLEVLRKASTDTGNLSGNERTRALEGARATSVEASRFLLLDLAELLSTHLPAVWQAVLAGTTPSTPAAAALAQLLATRSATSAGPTIQARLQAVWAQRLRIEAEAEPASDIDVDLRNAPFDAATLRAPIAAALAEVPAPAEPAPPGPAPDGADPAAVPKLGGDAQYVVRCVFRRPNCRPLPLDLVSEPSEPFRIAGFFDIDAPARPIRIELPIRTSIADLRKYPKNVGFMLSDQLREQMCRVTDMNAVLKGQLACGESIDVGMICSFSIPIITICALIVLLLFVNLLNIVFWWLPFFRLCLPILLPGKRS